LTKPQFHCEKGTFVLKLPGDATPKIIVSQGQVHLAQRPLFHTEVILALPFSTAPDLKDYLPLGTTFKINSETKSPFSLF